MRESEQIDIAAIERAVDLYRIAPRAKIEGSPENQTYEALKRVCTLLRADTPAGLDRAFRSIDEQVYRMRKRKAQIGYIPNGNQQALVEAILSHWPAICRALERSGEPTCSVKSG